MKVIDALRELLPEADRDTLFARIACGEVTVNGSVIRDPKLSIASGATVRLVAGRRYVSRGGLKLEGALALLSPVTGRTFIDAGCSTGGFTDCLLQHGARRVFAIDVGRNQLAYSLRTDPRVTVYERTNILSIGTAKLGEPADAAVCDLSFRSLRGVATHLLALVPLLVALVKPQFEWRDPDQAFRGVVEDMDTRKSIVRDLVADFRSDGITIRDGIASTLAGRSGNQEYFVALTTDSVGLSLDEILRRLFISEA